MPEHTYEGPAYDEFDFATIAEWGFDFARLPLSYWVWGSRDDWSVIREEPLKKIDRALDLGKQYGVHINLNFHRIPGYCINERELEPADLFTGTKAQRDKALAASVYHWKAFARRYKGIPNRRLSFDLINEPPKMRSYEGYLEERYVEIVQALVAAIREEDPKSPDLRGWHQHRSGARARHRRPGDRAKHSRLSTQSREPLHRHVGTTG